MEKLSNMTLHSEKTSEEQRTSGLVMVFNDEQSWSSYRAMKLMSHVMKMEKREEVMICEQHDGLKQRKIHRDVIVGLRMKKREGQKELGGV